MKVNKTNVFMGLWLLYMGGSFKFTNIHASGFFNQGAFLINNAPQPCSSTEDYKTRWSLVMQANKTNSPNLATWHTTAATGTYSEDYSTTFKLSDTDINAAAINKQFMVVHIVNGVCVIRVYQNCIYSHTTKVPACRTSYSNQMANVGTVRKGIQFKRENSRRPFLSGLKIPYRD